MNRKGFTLVEMLVVIIIIGIIMAIAIPNVVKIVGRQSDTEYSAHLKLVKSALDSFTLRYRGSLRDIDKDCIIMDYSYLIDEGVLEEDNIKCNGKVVMNKKKNNSFSYDYYLNCVDNKDNSKSSYEVSDLPTGCFNLTFD